MNHHVVIGVIGIISGILCALADVPLAYFTLLLWALIRACFFMRLRVYNHWHIGQYMIK